eukprot:TRINITY_DN10778_c0_g2_i1.p1 TRINITY_DN10778_c0_g2~~TRINITY_DN10778_c0_g2_i1.p1  ORF type:complete len:221 (+),score=15.47 TRINITY_DN10778_c0_g2_i1:93-755(+)
MKRQLLILFLLGVVRSRSLRQLKQVCDCEDVPPQNSRYSCEVLEQMGTCGQQYMNASCLCSCGKCGGDEDSGCTTALQHVQGANDLQIFASLLSASNLSDYLNSQQTAVTLFAPTDQAFQDFFGVMQSSFLEMFSYMKIFEPIISYHIVNQPLYRTQFLRGAVLDTMVQNQQGRGIIKVDEKDKSKLLGLGGPANIIQWDNTACNSVIHVIDRVLLPVDV